MDVRTQEEWDQGHIANMGYSIARILFQVVALYRGAIYPRLVALC